MSPDTGIVAVLRKGITDEEADRILADQCATARRLRLHGDVSVAVGALEARRSLSQNDMHCGLCRDIATALKKKTGMDYDVEYIRAKTKRKFGVVATQGDPETGKAEPFLISTAKYSAAQFSKLIDGTLAWGQTALDIPLPDPRR